MSKGYRIFERSLFILLFIGHGYVYFVKGKDMSNFDVMVMVLWSLSMLNFGKEAGHEG